MNDIVKDKIKAIEYTISREQPYTAWSIGLLGIHPKIDRDGPTIRPVYKLSPQDAKEVFDHFVSLGVKPLGLFDPKCEGIFIQR